MHAEYDLGRDHRVVRPLAAGHCGRAASYSGAMFSVQERDRVRARLLELA